MRRERRWELLTIPAALAALIGIWYLVVAVFDMPSYVLPSPTAVAKSLVALAKDGNVWQNMGVSLREAIFGLLIGLAAALLIGIPVALVPLVRKTLLPIVNGWQSFPHIILAPLIVIWFGFGEASKVVMAAILSFFPLFLSVVDGLTSSARHEIEMIRVFGGSSLDVFRRVRVRNALPYFFSGLHLSAVYALLGAVVGEWIGAQSGIGHLLLTFNFNFQVAEMFSALILLALIGVLVTTLIRFVRQRVVFWQR